MKASVVELFEGSSLEGSLHKQEVWLFFAVVEAAEDPFFLIDHPHLGITHGTIACLGERLHDRREYGGGREGRAVFLDELAKECHR